MKTIILLFCFQIAASHLASAQDLSSECWCDTSFNSIQEGTSRLDSINWSQIKCYYTQKRSKGSPKSVVNYRNGKRHGQYATYFPKEYWVQVKQRGYQQAVPRRYHRWKDFYRSEGKSLYGKSEVGEYIADNKNGVWYTMDTNQRITSKTLWDEGYKKEEGRDCNGVYDLPNTSYKSESDSITKLVATLANGTHDYFLSGQKIISFQIQDHQLNGQFTTYKKDKGGYIYTQSEFSNNCLTGVSVTFSIKGDTTRIESDFNRGIPYKIVSFTPSSRGTTYYRDPRNSYELNSDYRNGLIVERREKQPRK